MQASWGGREGSPTQGALAAALATAPRSAGDLGFPWRGSQEGRSSRGRQPGPSPRPASSPERNQGDPGPKGGCGEPGVGGRTSGRRRPKARHSGPGHRRGTAGPDPVQPPPPAGGVPGELPSTPQQPKDPPQAGPLPQALHVPTADKAQPRSCRHPGLSGQLEGRHFRPLPRQEVAPAGPAHAAGLFGFLSACTSSLPSPPPPGSRPACFLAIETDTTLSPALEPARVDGGAARPRGYSELARWPPLLPGGGTEAGKGPAKSPLVYPR